MSVIYSKSYKYYTRSGRRQMRAPLRRSARSPFEFELCSRSARAPLTMNWPYSEVWNSVWCVMNGLHFSLCYLFRIMKLKVRFYYSKSF